MTTAKAGAQDEVLMSIHDVRFRSRLLQLLIQTHLPRDGKLPVTPQHLPSAVEMLTRHHLLAEPGTNGGLGSVRTGGPAVFTGNGKLDGCAGNGTASRKLAVDTWTDRLASLIASPVVENRAIGACLLGLTCKECLLSRFRECYSGWFSTLLTMLKSIEPSFVRAAACAALSDLLVRLGSLIDCPGVRRDGSALVSKLTVPLLQLLRDVQLRGIWSEGVDLICPVLRTFPLCLRSSFEKVEAVLVMMLMNTGCKNSLRQRCAEGLALLPLAVGDSNTWSLLIRRVLVAINSELDVAFAGLEDPGSTEVAMAELLPCQQEILPLGGPSVAAEAAAFGDGETPFWRSFVPRVSALFHTLEFMLTNPYPSPVPMPLRPLLGLIMRVLAVDGSRPVGTSSLGGQASLSQQASLCSELPVLHAGALNLLSATLKGARRQLLPVAGEIARLMSDCLRRSATLPDDKRSTVFTFKIHLYNVITEFLYATGAGGMVLSLAPVLVGIAVSDLRGPGRGGGGAGGGMMKSYSHDQYKGNQLLRQGPAGVSFPSRQAPLVGNTSASGVASSQHSSMGVSMPQPNLQSGGGIGLNGHHSQASASTMRKRKEPSGTVLSDEQLSALVGASILFSEEGGVSTDSLMFAMYIAVLEVLEALLTVGGSMLPERWRAEVDAVIINVAMAVCHNADVSVDGAGGVGGTAEGALGGVKTVTHSLQIAACKALLASVLAPHCHRPPFLPQALSIFRRCRHEAGTELSQFCTHALLACEPLHPRALPYPVTTSPISSAPVGHGKGFMALNNNLAANKMNTANFNRAVSGNAAASDRWTDSQHHSGSGDPWEDLDSWLGCADYASDMERAEFGSGFDLMDINGAMMQNSDALLGKAGGGDLKTAAAFGYGGANQRGGSEVGMRGTDQVSRGLAAMACSPPPIYAVRLAAAGDSKDIVMPDVGTTSQRGRKSGELLMKTSTSYSTVPMAIANGTSPGNDELMNRVTGGRMVDQAGAEPNLPTEKLGTRLQTAGTTGTAATTGGSDAGMRDLYQIMDVEPSAGGGGGEGGGGVERSTRIT